MADGFVHTVHRDGAWRNTIEGQDDPLPARTRQKRTRWRAGGRKPCGGRPST